MAKLKGRVLACNVTLYGTYDGILDFHTFVDGTSEADIPAWALADMGSHVWLVDRSDPVPAETAVGQSEDADSPTDGV